MSDWLLMIPFALGVVSYFLTKWAWKALHRPEPEPEPDPCEHPWFIDGRCMVCGTPKP